jgi:hypothetical protein
MSLPRFTLLLGVLLVLGSPLHAEVYKYYDSNGNLVLSDSLPKDKNSKAEKIETRPIMTIPALDATRKGASAADKAPAKPLKYVILVQSPAPEATFQRSEGDIPLAVSVTPGLQPEHHLEVLMDGALVSSDGSGTLKVDDLERGSHTLLVKVLDTNGKTVASNQSTFYLQQPSALGPTRNKPKPK